MFGTHDLVLFVLSGLLLNLFPGPDNLLIVTRATAAGRAAGLATAAGITTGTFVHVFAAAFGLSAILTTSAQAFTIVKLAGAAYLVYMGATSLLGSLRRASPTADAATTQAGDAVSAVGVAKSAAALRRDFARGFLTNVLNPKVALFFLAFVPQFIDASAASKPLAFLFLGSVFNFNGLLFTSSLAVFAASLGARLKASERTRAWLNRAMGTLFIALGIRLALARRD